MKDILTAYMKIGTVFEVAFPNAQRNPAFYLRCLERIAGDDFYQAIEITSIADQTLRKEAAKILHNSGLAVAYCAQPILLGEGRNLNALAEEERTKAVNRLKECIDEACELGAESLSFLAGTYEDETLDKVYGYLVESIDELCCYINGRLHLEIEIFDYDLDKCSLIGPSRRAANLARELREKHNNFWLLPDLSHIPQQHEAIEECLNLVMPYIRRTHIGNCVIEKGSPAFGDQHPPFSYPGSSIGVRELALYLQMLLNDDLLNQTDRPMVSFEIKPRQDEDIEEVLQENQAILIQAGGMLHLPRS